MKCGGGKDPFLQIAPSGHCEHLRTVHNPSWQPLMESSEYVIALHIVQPEVSKLERYPGGQERKVQNREFLSVIQSPTRSESELGQF